MAETQKTKETKEEEAVTAEVVTPMTLPQLLGLSVTRLLTVLQNGDTGAKQTEMLRCRTDLNNWYLAQTPTNRAEFAKQQRKVLENFKLLGEQFASDFAQMTAGDVA